MKGRAKPRFFFVSETGMFTPRTPRVKQRELSRYGLWSVNKLRAGQPWIRIYIFSKGTRVSLVSARFKLSLGSAADPLTSSTQNKNIWMYASILT